jgi:hypothetical protein
VPVCSVVEDQFEPMGGVCRPGKSVMAGWRASRDQLWDGGWGALPGEDARAYASQHLAG